MATTVGQHTVATFTSPVNGTTPIDANTVRGNDNTLRTSYNDHDSDTGIHVQSSTFASRPVAGTAGRKWITVDVGGDLHLWYDTGTIWEEVGNSGVEVLCIANSTLSAGDVVKIVGFNNGQSLPVVDIVNSGSDVGFGVVDVNIASGASGYVVNTGVARDFDTSSFAVGDVLYKDTSGGFTTTKPASGEYQPCAIVLRSNANNGALYVEFSAPRIVERSDNTASTVVLRDASGNFAAGTITAGALTSTGLVTFASLKGTGATTVTNILDEDNMASNSATALATQQSIKAYVDSQVATVDTLAEILVNGNTSGGTNLIMSAGDTLTVNTIAETTVGAGVTIDSVLLKDDVVNATDIEVSTISANDGVQSAVVASATGVMTIASSVLTTTDINGGTIDGTTIGGATPAVGTFTTANATTVDTTNLEVTTLKAKDGTSAGSIADATGVVTLASSVLTTTDINGGTVDGAVIGGASAAAGTFTTLTANTNLTIAGTTTVNGVIDDDTMATASATKLATSESIKAYVDSQVTAQDLDFAGDSGTGQVDLDSQTFTIAGTAGEIETSASGQTITVGLPTNVTIAGNLTVDTNTLFVDATNNRVGIGTASPDDLLHIEDIDTTPAATQLTLEGYATGYSAGINFVSRTSVGGTRVSMAKITAGAEDSWSTTASTQDAGLRFFTTWNGSQAERVRIDHQGRVGIGTASPAARLDVVGASAGSTVATFTSNETGSTTSLAVFQRSGGAVAAAVKYNASNSPLTIDFGTTTNHGLTFLTNNTERMRIDSSGNVGIGVTPSGSFKLEVANGDASIYGITVGRGAGAVYNNTAVGASALAGSNSGTGRNTAVGIAALTVNSTGSNNTGIGQQVLTSNTTGTDNSGVGYAALYLNTTGSFNTAMGVGALLSNTTASYNTAVGYHALYTNTTGTRNDAFGRRALYSNQTASDNAAFGYAALSNNTTGASNIAIGRDSVALNTTGSYNVAVGQQALGANTTGPSNIAVGYQAGYSNTIGSGNISIGHQAGYDNATANYNVGIGYQALNHTTASSNTAVGYRAAFGNSTGSNNTAFGYQAAYSNSSGIYNTFVGAFTGYSVTTGSGNTFIGTLGSAASAGCGYAMTTGSNNTIIGGYTGNQGGLDIRASDGNIVISGGSGTPIVWYTGSSIYNVNNTTTWNTTSDERIKKNFVPVTNGLNIINALEPFEFDYIIGGKHDVGFKAQQYGAVLPSQLTENDCVGEELKALTDGEPVKGLQRNLDPYFVSAIKTLTEEFNKLKAGFDAYKETHP